jgi:PKD repeat protein
MQSGVSSNTGRRRARFLFPVSVFLLIAGLLAARPSQAQPAFSEGGPPPGVHGQEAIQALGDQLPVVAARYNLTAEELRTLLQQNPDLWVDADGRLVYYCQFEGIPPAPIQAGDSVLQGPYPNEQTFLLHSNPGGSRVIYLDFDGHTTTGTPWNSGRGDIVSAPFDLDGSPTTWSQAELDRIQYIWQRVAEDFIMYDVDVTTQDPGIEALRKTNSSDGYYGQRVVISPTNWYSTNAGGVAYIGSFNWNSDTPCYAFTAQLANGEKYIAEAASHETGHTLGLYHDGTTAGVEYYAGHGNWAPIMGVGYYKAVVQWSKGEYANANNTEDDLAKMPGYGPQYRADDHGNTNANATLLSSPNLSGAGIIERSTDADVFSFLTGAGSISINVNPSPRDPNLDILAELYDAGGSLVASSNPAGMAASIAATVPAGTYYLRIDGVGTGDPTTGYSDYGSIGQYTISGTVINPGNQPPIAAAQANPASGVSPLAVSFTGSASYDPDGGNLASYAWTFGDGGTANVADTTHTYTVAGTYTAVLTVTDDEGLSDTDSVTITVTEPPNQLPVAVATATPASGDAPLAVAFSGSDSKDPDGSIASFTWTFGDGSTGNGATVNHTYNSAGTYTAVLTVTDNRGGTGSKSLTISVTQDPAKEIFVTDILMGKNKTKQGTAATARVTIQDGAGNLYDGARVSGTWSGLAKGNASGSTNNGTVTFTSSATKKRGTITFTVTGVTTTQPGYAYNSSRNSETSDSIAVP